MTSTPALRFTMSGLARAIECPAHLVLPHSRTSSAFASHGRVVHEFLERVRSMGAEAAINFVPEEHRAACESLDLDNPALALDPSAYAAEVAFAYDVRTGKARELGRGLNRDYSGASKWEVCGTADVVGLTDDAVIILDYKTGWADLGPLWRNWQLRAYALAASRAYGRKRAVVIIVRIKSDGDAYATPGEELSELDLMLTAAEMEHLVAKTVELEALRQEKGNGALPTSQGPWCTYCPAFDFCPSKTALVRAALAGEVTTPEDEFADEAWAVAVEQLGRLEAVVKRMRGTIETRAMGRIIPLAVGEVMGPVQKSSRWIDARAGLETLLEFFGADVERLIEHKVTLDALRKKAAPPVIRGRKDASTGRKLSATRYVDDVFARLEERGAAGTRYTYPVTRHKVRKDEVSFPDDLGGTTDVDDKLSETE